MKDRAGAIFGKRKEKKAYRTAVKFQKKYIRAFGDDSDADYKVTVMDNPHIGELLGVKNVLVGDEKKNDHYNPKSTNTYEFDRKKGILLGSVYMDVGSFRIPLAMASAAHAMGYVPYWMDFNSYNQTTCTKVIGAQREIYRMGLSMSHRRFFGKKVWEPMNDAGRRTLDCTAMNQMNTELMIPVCRNIPKDIPMIGTHVWTSQTAVHAGMKYVVNAIPDSRPMAFQLAEGAVHTIACHSSYMGYRTLYGMAGESVCSPMPQESLCYTGHYIDHELVANIEADCEARMARQAQGQPVRLLLCIRSLREQKTVCVAILRYLLPLIQKNKVVLYMDTGDFHNTWKALVRAVPELEQSAELHFDSFKGTSVFCAQVLQASERVRGIHVFCHRNPFEAAYCTVLLMRSCDVLITCPDELAFYPVPKLLLKSLEPSQAWTAVHAAEMGDATIECTDIGHTLSMLDLLLKDGSIRNNMCRNIMENRNIGLYDGAYRAVELAMGLRK